GVLTQYDANGAHNLSQQLGLGTRPLLAGADTGADPGTALDQAQLQGVVAAALSRLRDAGVDPGLVARLASAQYLVGAVPQGWLGAELPGAQEVVLSPDAAGRGWFLDPTPLA